MFSHKSTFLISGIFFLLLFLSIIEEPWGIFPLRKKASCLGCHPSMAGFSPSHNPDKIGCSACHLGEPGEGEKEKAHRAMIPLPSNLEVVKKTCGTVRCHPTLSVCVQNSLMASGRGIVSVTRYVLGERDNPNGKGHLSRLSTSPADKYLRNLCAPCHLNYAKKTAEPISQQSRGGGCSACHLHYSPKAKRDLVQYKKKGILPQEHPSLTIEVGDHHCFGCHSRSSRISTSYRGWHETLFTPQEIAGSPKGRYSLLEDGRVFISKEPDIHFLKGFSCVDCHGWRETMGDGTLYKHEEDQVKIQCSDCHFQGSPKIISGENFSPIEKKIMKLRGEKIEGKRFVVTKRGGFPILGAYLDENNQGVFQLKESKKVYSLKGPARICTSEIAGHSRLSCQSCHSSWAPQCVSCHSQYDSDQKGWDHLERKKMMGRWREKGGDFLSDPPSLGVFKSRVQPFVPAMILTLKIHKGGKEREIFRRIYGPLSAHTISARGRTCLSCHANPLALGFGRGTLSVSQDKGGKIHWTFHPLYGNHPKDGLPFDSWIQPFGFPKNMNTTRLDGRPFTPGEQRSILRVGICLKCHGPTKRGMEKIYQQFGQSLKYHHFRPIIEEKKK